MIKTLTPYPNSAKTAEIMSRYRPIAPKPETSSTSMNEGSTSQKIKSSPYLRSLWSQLQARPTRTRKRGRAPLTLPSTLKRQKTHVLGICPPCHVSTSPSKNLSFQTFPSLPQFHFPPSNRGLGMLNANTNQNLVTLPLLPCTPEKCPTPKFDSTKEVVAVAIDLNTTAKNIPEERDFLQLLQRPVCNKVIAPQPIRPIGSCINVGCISDHSTTSALQCAAKVKRKHEVEEEVESETLPAVISDSNNRIRMANSAYKEMVGQPECAWLESMVSGGGGANNGRFVQCSKRISGEVTLNLCDSSMVVPISSNGFSCWVRIEWESEQKKVSVNAFCDVLRLTCESKDYLFTWRFHTRTREGSQPSCNV
ncbi:hypothetical protein Lal_00003128 [Lupinus albus]|uniref:DUF7950 domain-containing protein n=1 Tax=Lupinus albus TaxID=3870 RepID=A0A6A5N6N5_LUPAL|nr:hypothetical protein Lalb_Chr22g0355691 [Lupinus albus]KAF1882946.1 hypothetical protein Lal_00003128 [Lupinus albus]